MGGMTKPSHTGNGPCCKELCMIIREQVHHKMLPIETELIHPLLQHRMAARLLVSTGCHAQRYIGSE